MRDIEGLTDIDISEEISTYRKEVSTLHLRVFNLETEQVMRKYDVKVSEHIRVLAYTNKVPRAAVAEVIGGTNFLHVRLLTKSGNLSKVKTVVYHNKDIIERKIQIPKSIDTEVVDAN